MVLYIIKNLMTMKWDNRVKDYYDKYESILNYNLAYIFFSIFINKYIVESLNLLKLIIIINIK